MHVGTHFFAGWLVAASVPELTRRERAMIAFAGVAPDLDGLGLFGEYLTRNSAHPVTWYSDYHHVLGHNLTFALVVAGITYAFARRRAVAAALAVVSFHLHLLFDILGSRGTDGYQWPLPYLWPFSNAWQLTWSGQWTFDAWPNTAITVALVLATLGIAWRKGFSPVSIFSPRADEIFVATLRARFPKPAP